MNFADDYGTRDAICMVVVWCRIWISLLLIHMCQFQGFFPHLSKTSRVIFGQILRALNLANSQSESCQDSSSFDTFDLSPSKVLNETE